jgi:maltooligosyltrehalose trehalohydrolase
MPPEARPLAAFCTLMSPFVPLLFMGEEYGENAPFQFFSDHIDPEIAQATREGRRSEFASFAAFAHEEVPDPQDPATFERSRLTRERDPEVERLYRQLLEVRRELPTGDAEKISYDEAERWLRVRRGPFEVICNFGSREAALPSEGTAVRLATAEDCQLENSCLRVPPLSGVLLQDVRVPASAPA